MYVDIGKDVTTSVSDPADKFAAGVNNADGQFAAAINNRRSGDAFNSWQKLK
jgi:hypothetical protein